MFKGQRSGKIVILMLALSCNSGQQLNRAESTTQGEDPALDTIGTQTFSLPAPPASSDAAAAKDSRPPAAPEPKDQDDEDDKDKMAMEPVAIGGAYLTCRYPAGQKQGSETYQLDCDVAPVTEVKTAIAKAEFFKIDAQGTRTALPILTQDLLGLKWSLKELPGTLAQNKVQVVLSALNATAVTLTTTIANPLALTRIATYWLGGEPNNFVDANNQDEDCIEFSNQAMKISHQNTSGITTGPLGRMNDIICTTRSNALCRYTGASTTAAKWVLSVNAVAFANAARACPANYVFSLPMTDAEVKEVSALVDRNTQGQNIWINMNDRTKENEFVVAFP